MIAFLPRDSTNYCIPRCNGIWPRDTRPFFPAALPATPTNTGGKGSGSRDYLLSMYGSLCLIDHGAVSVLCWVGGDGVLPCEQTELSSTNDDKSCDKSSSCSQVVSTRIQRRRLLLPFPALATTFHTPVSLQQHQEPCQVGTFPINVAICNLIGVHCTVHTHMAMYYELPDPFLIF